MSIDDDLLEGHEPSEIPDGGLERLLARATHEARSSVCITDAQLDRPGPRIVYVNPAFCRMTGYQAHEVLGQNPRFLQGPLTDRAVLDRVRTDLAAGRPFEGETFNYRKDGRPFRMAWRIAPVHDHRGTITHYVAAQEDVTTVREAERTLRQDASQLQVSSDWLGALVSLSVTLSRTSDPDDVLARVVEAAVQQLDADGAAIVLTDPDHDDWVMACAAGLATAEAGARFTPLPGSLIAQALQRGTSIFLTESHTPIGAGLGLGEGALALLPIGNVATAAYGVLVLTWQTNREFRPTERTHFGLLARLTTLTHRKTKDLEDQRMLATTLQRSLLPVLDQHEGGLEVASRYLPAHAAEVGGDWFDVVPLGQGRTAVFVGDVVGHGFAAAALMGEIRHIVRGLLRAFTEPGQLFDQLDATLLDAHRPGEALATVCAVVIEADGAMHYCSAGHPYPVIRRGDGSIELLEGAQCRLIGVHADGPSRATARARLHPGDSLVAFTDGVFEIRDHGYDETYAALVGRLEASDGSPKALCDAALGTRSPDGVHARDDMAVLAVRCRADAAGEGSV